MPTWNQPYDEVESLWIGKGFLWKFLLHQSELYELFLLFVSLF